MEVPGGERERKAGRRGEPAKNVGQLIDEAMDAVMKANPTLVGTLPRLYNRDNVDQRRLGELIDLFNSARFTGQGEHKARDLLGEVYEYFLGKFATRRRQTGRRVLHPASVVKVLVEVLEPTRGRVYDPCCGSGGMFVQTEKFISNTTATRRTSRSTDRRATSGPGGWRR